MILTAVSETTFVIPTAVLETPFVNLTAVLETPFVIVTAVLETTGQTGNRHSCWIETAAKGLLGSYVRRLRLRCRGSLLGDTDDFMIDNLVVL